MDICNIERDESGKICKFEYVKYGGLSNSEQYRLIFMRRNSYLKSEQYRLIFMRRNSYSKFWITIAVFRNMIDLDGGTVSFMTRESYTDGEQVVFDKLIASGIKKLEEKLKERKNKIDDMYGTFFNDKE